MTNSEVAFIVVLGASLILNVALLIAVVATRKDTSSSKCSGTKKASSRVDDRIIGGTKASSRNQYPFMASVIIKKDAGLDRDAFKCGATIITRYWIVTAGHCFEEGGIIDTKYYKIHSNSLMWWKGVSHDINLYFVHPNFNENFYTENDIALAKVKNAFRSKFERPIAMAGNSYKFQTNRTVTIIGWGLPYDYKDHHPRPLNDLHETKVQLFDQIYCRKLYSQDNSVRVAKTMICAADYTGGKDACVFHSGGPMIDDKLLIGLISWRGECGNPTSPGVYTRINAFTKWILRTGKNNDKTFKPIFKNKP